MKILMILCALGAIAFNAFAITDSNVVSDRADTSEPCQIELKNEPLSGMFFSTKHVVEEYEIGDDIEVGAIRYTDPDAGLEECEILLCWECYVEVLTAIERGETWVGTAYIISEFEGTAIFGIEWE